MNLPAAMNNAISPPIGMIDRICVERERLIGCYRKILTINKTIDRVSQSRLPNILNREFNYISDVNVCMEKIINEIDAAMWRRAINECGFASVMNAEMLDDLYRQIDSDCPPIDRETMTATLMNHFANAQKTFIEGAIYLFTRLDRGFKSHDGFKIGSRVILSGLSHHGWSFYGRGKDAFNDFSRIMMVLDGENPAALNGSEQHAYIIEKVKMRGETSFDTPYFRCNFYGNGNVHIWPLRDDLIMKINGMIADHYGHQIGRKCA